MPNDPEDPLSRGQYRYDLPVFSENLQIYKILLDLFSLSAHPPWTEVISWPAAPDNEGERKFLHIETDPIRLFPLNLFIIRRPLQYNIAYRHPRLGYQGIAGDANIIG